MYEYANNETGLFRYLHIQIVSLNDVHTIIIWIQWTLFDIIRATPYKHM